MPTQSFSPAEYLQSQGWRGEGCSLDDSNLGLTKPLRPRSPVRTSRFEGLKVIEKPKPEVVAIQSSFSSILERLNHPEKFETREASHSGEESQVTGKPQCKEKRHQGWPYGFGIAKRPALYAGRKRGKTLEGTIGLSSANEQVLDAMATGQSPHPETEVEMSGAVQDSLPTDDGKVEEVSRKKRKHRDDNSIEGKASKKTKYTDVNQPTAPESVSTSDVEETAPVKVKKEKKKKHKKDVSGVETKHITETGTIVDNDSLDKEVKKEKKRKERKEKQQELQDEKEFANGTPANNHTESPSQEAPPSTKEESTAPKLALQKPEKKVRWKNDMLPPNHPQNHKAWRERQQLQANGNMNPDRLTMIQNAAPAPPDPPDHPVPSGPVIEGTDPPRRQYVIKDFLPFVKGSEWSRRRAERRGKPIRRSPRSIRKEARELMQEHMIREAIECGEEPPKFEKPLTRRQMREEKKARKKDPAVRALKFQRRRLQKVTQRERNAEVKKLRGEGKHDEADELSRKPLFPKVEVGPGQKTSEDEGEDSDSSSDDETDSDAESSGSSTDDLEDISDIPESDSENLTQDQKEAQAERRKKRRAERKREHEAKRGKPKKTKKQKTEERYAKMPTVPPPVLPIPKFQTVTKGIPLPYTQRRGSLKELKQILKDTGLTRDEQNAYIHKAMVDKQEQINIKQSRRAAMRRERKKKRGLKKHAKHIRCQQEMAVNRRKKEERRRAGEYVETSSEKKKRHRREKEEKEARKRAEKYKHSKEGDSFIPI